jgi:pyruvate dehydrogenase E2 component (dihydrolipoamide acetyltransferase)
MSDEIRVITMPKWGLSMTEGMVAQWNVAEGAEIKAGDEVVEIETTKITNVYESPVSGTLRRLVVAEGETIPVRGLLAVVADAAATDADIDAFIAKYQAELGEWLASGADDGPQYETAQVGGLSLRYLKLGDAEGRPLLLLHGFSGDLNNWMFNQPALAQRASVYALDLPGHGVSSKTIEAGDIGAMAAAVLGFMDAVGIPTAHLVGHSMGGGIALQLALDHPDRVSSLTLIAPIGLGPDINAGFINGFIAASRRKDMKPVLAQLFADESLVNRDMINDVLKYKRLDGVEPALKRIAEAVFADNRQSLVLIDRLGELVLPAQCIWGADDRIVPAAHGAGLPANITVHTLVATGHMAHMEKAGDVNRLIEEFVSGA